MRSKTLVLVLGIILLLSLSHIVKASPSCMVTFTYGYVEGTLDFPEEAHATDTVTCNLTISALADVTIYNFTLAISGFVGAKWQTLRIEPITSYSMAAGENLTRQVSVTLPQNTSERLHYVIEVSATSSFGKTDFYATYVRPISYDELSGLYNALQNNLTNLQADYNQLQATFNFLNSTYSSLASQFAFLQTGFNSLNSSYETLNTTYSSLASNYNSMQDTYNYIRTKYDSSTGELSIVRNLMYILGITTVILAATTIYFRKKAPYIVVQKETASNKP